MPSTPDLEVTITANADQAIAALTEARDATDDLAGEKSTYAQTVTRLARRYNQLTVDGEIPPREYFRIVTRLHAAADRAGISQADAATDLQDEVEAGPVNA
jgi:hypothetical protein